MLSALDQQRDYYKLNNWDYVKYAEALGCPGIRVRTAGELNSAISIALKSTTPYLIEAVLSKEDHAPIMKRIKDFVHQSV